MAVFCCLSGRIRRRKGISQFFPLLVSIQSYDSLWLKPLCRCGDISPFRGDKGLKLLEPPLKGEGDRLRWWGSLAGLYRYIVPSLSRWRTTLSVSSGHGSSMWESSVTTRSRSGSTKQRCFHFP